MNAFRRRVLTNVYKLFDLMLIVVSFGLAAVVASYGSGSVSFSRFLALQVKVENFVLFSILLLVGHISYSMCGLYRSHRLGARRDEMVDLLKASTLGMLGMFLIAFLFHIQMITPLFLVAFWVASTVLVVASRILLRRFLGRVRVHGRNLRHMLVVGTGRRAVQFARKIAAKPELGYRIIGFVDDDWPGLQEFHQTGYPLVCNFENFASYLRDSVVDEVIMGLPVRSAYLHASRIAGVCEEQGILIRLLPRIFDLKMARSRAEEFDGDPLITLYTGTSEGWPMVVKRVLDFTVSLILLALLAPVFLVTAILIKLTSPGPVFFRQKRVGLSKRRFAIYKFRTMVTDAEKKQAEIEHLNEVSGPVFKIKNDPRITPVGRFLRKTSIDELPQLFNVLRGEMSLVGPRPLPVRDYEGFDQDWQRRRFIVRPGITCLWQINGRSSISFERWMELDLEYVDKWSLWLDLKILIRTVPAVLKGSGAT